ncbi:MAG: prolipoprotein diacylglyceryl transferase [Clostridia bacterium]|nr:prolipoprotein diacylglyceryl transferase [Clostridia bacterium]
MFNSLLADNPGITIFGFRIYAYALVIVFGMICAFFVISLLFKRRNMSTDLFMTYFCVTLPVALFTTRLFYCITDGLPISEWFALDSIRSGGLSIIGGILGGVISVVLVSYFKKVNFFRAGDCIVIGLLLAQAIGRWGNFFNQEVYGAEVTNESLQFFPFAVYINNTADGNCFQTFTLTFAKLFNTGGGSDISGGTWHYAFFFYESFFNLLGAALMFVYAWKNPKKPNGVITAWYFIQYGLVRSIMEPLRDPEYILSGGGVPWSLVMSILMCVAGTALLIVMFYLNKKKEGVFFGSLNGDPYGITEYIKDSPSEKAYFNKINVMCKLHPEMYEEKPPKEADKKQEDETKTDGGEEEK